MLRGHLPPPESLLAFMASRLDDLPGGRSPTVRDFRQTAAATFGRVGLPGPRAEAWKYTPLPQMIPEGFVVPTTAPRGEFMAAARSYLARLPSVPRVVFVDGRYAPEMSNLASAESSLSVRLLGRAFDEDPEAVARRVGLPEDERSLTALNAALVDHGCLIDVAGGAPAKLLLVSVVTGDQGGPTLINTRHSIRVAPGAEVEIGEVDLLIGDQTDVLNRVVQVDLGEGGRLKLERAQVGRASARVVAALDVRLQADSRLTHGVAILGGALARSEIAASLEGSGIEATFNGLSQIGTGQHVDHALNIRHEAPSSVSDQFYKGVVDGKGRSAFAGKIVVERPAQKTNAYQSNNNLLLSPDAEANAKPELEIYADDVKCSHGATAGELDERGLFYLRSRGLDVGSARALLTFAFLGEVLERFEDSLVVDLVRHEVLERLGTEVELEGLAA